MAEERQEAFLGFFTEFINESDRAAVVLGAAKLDYLLAELINKVLLPPENKKDDKSSSEEGQPGTLGSFNANINIAYRLGLIDESFKKSLHIIRDLRNHFAHEPEGCRLTRRPYLTQVGTLKKLYNKLDRFSEGVEIIQECTEGRVIKNREKGMVKRCSPKYQRLTPNTQGGQIMRRGLKIFTIVSLLTIVCCSFSFGEEFRMKTGEMVSGELMSYEDGTFRVKSKFGILSIEASDLAAIGVNTEEGIVDIVLGTSTKDNRDRITGTIEYVREGELKIKTEYGYVVVNPMNKATGIFLSEAAAGKMPKPGAPAESKEKLFEGKEFSDKHVTQRVVDVIRTETGEIKVAVLHISNLEKSYPTRLDQPEQYTYIVDNDGEKYPYVGSEGISIDHFDFPPKVPVRLWFTFGSGKTEKPIKAITFFSRLHFGKRGYVGLASVDVVIPDIPLK